MVAAITNQRREILKIFLSLEGMAAPDIMRYCHYLAKRVVKTITHILNDLQYGYNFRERAYVLARQQHYFNNFNEAKAILELIEQFITSNDLWSQIKEIDQEEEETCIEMEIDI